MEFLKQALFNSLSRMRPILFAFLFIFIYPVSRAGAQVESTFGSSLSDSKKKLIEQNFQNLPASFRKNMGQWDDNILFESGSSGIHIYFMKDGISYTSVREVGEKGGERSNHMQMGKHEMHEYLVWNMKFIGCNKLVKCSSEGERKSNVNYLLGNDPSRFVTNAPDYSLIQYHELYDKIDLRYYTSGSKIEYDYIVKPGGKVDEIKMSFEGVKKVRIKKEGVLEVKTAWGTTTDLAPYSYQVINGEKIQVDIRYYLLNDTTIGFYTDNKIDPKYDLIIDPVILFYSTYVGAPQPSTAIQPWGYVYDITSDSQGNVYAVGWYDGTGFPTKPGNYDATYNLNTDVFVFKLKPDGTDIVYGTYIGGNQNDQGFGIALDNTGNAYLTGITNSPNFPVTPGAFDVAFNAGKMQPFAIKLNAAGSALVYSTFVGDRGTGEGVAVNVAGEAYLTGKTDTIGFPTTPGCYDNTFNGGLSDVFVTKLNAAGNAVMYSTYVGGSTDAMTASEGTLPIGWNGYGGSELGCRIALDPAGDAYVTGFSTANNFPTTPGCVDPAFNNTAGTSKGDVFVFKLSMQGGGPTDLKYSTYLGGSNNDQGFDIDVNSLGEAFVSGSTWSSNFPTTAGAYDQSFDVPVVSGSPNAFMVRLNPQGSALMYSTFMGEGYGMSTKVNSKNQAYLSVAYPSYKVPLNACSYNNTKSTGVALYKLNPAGSNLMFSGVIGGGNIDADFANTHITLVKNGCNDDLVMSNATHSNDFPVTAGAFQTFKRNAEDQIAVTRFTQTFSANFTLPSATCNVSASFVNTTNQCGLWDSVQTWSWDFGDGTFSNLASPAHTYSAPGTYTIKLIAYCPDDTISKTITVNGVCGMTATANSATICANTCATITASVANGKSPYTYLWNTGETTQSISPCPLSTKSYTVTVTDNTGVAATSVATITVNSAITISAVSTNISCNGGTGSVTATVAGGAGPYTYLWSTGAIVVTGSLTSQISNLAPAIYTVTVTDAKNCTGMHTAAIVSPPALAGQFNKGTASCTGCGCKEWIMVNASGGTSPYSYTWPDGYVNRYKNQICPGTYSVNIKDKNGCSVNMTVSAP